uniref:ABC transporter ATP-binding protein n=1 Tax=Actinotalea sp. TaxID=1872145 RepID=UPI0035660552
MPPPPPGDAVARPPAVSVDSLQVRYGSRRAVDGLSLEAAPGAVTALLGPNGAGKSSTVECCIGLRRPDAGRITVLGRDPVRDARRLRPLVGVMLQDGGLPNGAPAGQVLRHVASMYRHPRDLGELTARLGLDRFLGTTVRRLSGGERQRLALAAAIVGRPAVLFLDEPSAGLDPQARHAVWELVDELRTDGTSIVLTTHQMAEAETLADHVVIVDEGAVLAQGSVADLVGEGSAVHLGLAAGTDAAAARDALQQVLDTQQAGSATGSRVRLVPAGGLEVDGGDGAALLALVTSWAHGAGVGL